MQPINDAMGKAHDYMANKVEIWHGIFDDSCAYAESEGNGKTTPSMELYTKKIYSSASELLLRLKG